MLLLLKCVRSQNKRYKDKVWLYIFCTYGPKGYFYFLQLFVFRYYCNQNKRMLTVNLICLYARLKIQILNLEYCLGLQYQVNPILFLWPTFYFIFILKAFQGRRHYIIYLSMYIQFIRIHNNLQKSMFFLRTQIVLMWSFMYPHGLPTGNIFSLFLR